MHRRFVEVALIVIVLLCVPALTRVPQRLDFIGTVPQASGLSRNCDAPPKRSDLSSERPTTIAIEPSVVAVQSIPNVLQSDYHVQSDEPLPHAPITSPPDSLRAPPVSSV
jgi:hypothetical protein